MSLEISVDSIYTRLGLPNAPVLLDMRGETHWSERPRMIPGALRRDPANVETWADHLPRAPQLVAYFSGSGIDREALARLARLGHPTQVLAGGLDAWIAAGHSTIRVRADLKHPGATRWVTRERPKIDRLACPWLIRRFIDPEAQFFYTAPHRVRSEATDLGAEPYDIKDVTFSHRGSHCSFDAFLDEFELRDPILDEVAAIVRAADTGTLGDSREAPGLLAISLGLSANIAEDILLLEQAMSIYDALYAWRKSAAHETHTWPQTGT